MYAKIHKILEVETSISRSEPAELSVLSKGQATTDGWTGGSLIAWSYTNTPDDGIQDFDFIAEVPTTGVADVLSGIEGHGRILVEPWMRGVRVHAVANSFEKEFHKATKKIAPPIKMGGEVPWPLAGKVPLDFDTLKKIIGP